MRAVWLLPIPVGILLFGGLTTRDSNWYPDPERMTPISVSDYRYQAEAYAHFGKKEQAINSCEAMLAEYPEKDSASALCLLHVYEEFDDLDGQIDANMRILERQVSDGLVEAPKSTRRRIAELTAEKAEREKSEHRKR